MTVAPSGLKLAWAPPDAERTLKRWAIVACPRGTKQSSVLQMISSLRTSLALPIGRVRPPLQNARNGRGKF